MADDKNKRGERDERYHNRGQEDESKGKYDPPHPSPLGGWTLDSDSAKDNDRYREGWRQSRDQRDSSNDSGGGCFITTATLKATGKEDSCEELQTFRMFRDKWLALQPTGRIDIEEYYCLAPLIVRRIEASADRHEIYATIWSDTLMPCLDDIRNGRHQSARVRYTQMIGELKMRFLS